MDDAEYFLYFHDGKSRGTLADIKIVERANKPFKYFTINEIDAEQDLDINIDDIGI